MEHLPGDADAAAAADPPPPPPPPPVRFSFVFVSFLFVWVWLFTAVSPHLFCLFVFLQFSIPTPNPSLRCNDFVGITRTGNSDFTLKKKEKRLECADGAPTTSWAKRKKKQINQERNERNAESMRDVPQCSTIYRSKKKSEAQKKKKKNEEIPTSTMGPCGAPVFTVLFTEFFFLPNPWEIPKRFS